MTYAEEAGLVGVWLKPGAEIGGSYYKFITKLDLLNK